MNKPIAIPEWLLIAKGYVNTRDIARLLGISSTTFAKWKLTGKIPAPDLLSKNFYGCKSCQWKASSVINLIKTLNKGIASE